MWNNLTKNVVVPPSLLAPVIVGLVLICVIFIVRRKRANVADDFLLNILEMLGWLFAVGGITALFFVITNCLFLIPTVIAMVVAAVVTRHYRDSEKKALVAALAVAAERGLSLGLATRAFVEERSAIRSHRVVKFADLLDAGMPLNEAIEHSRLRLSTETVLAVRIGQLTGNLGSALRQSIQGGGKKAVVTAVLQERLLYLLVLLLLIHGLVVFWLVKLYPMFEDMYAEFGMTMPAITELLAAGVGFSVHSGVDNFYMLGLGGLLAVCLLYYLGLRTEFPVLRRLWLPADSCIVLRALAGAIRRQCPIPVALTWLATEYPKKAIRARVRRSVQYVERGEKWTRGLRGAGLVRSGEAAVLDAAERAGNLPWALDEIAERASSRSTVRFQRMLDILFPVVIFLMGLLVLCIAAAQMIPLFQLIKAGT